MSLLLWLPFVKGNCKNQGLLDVETSTLGTISYEDGKLGKAVRIGNGTQVVNGVQINTNLVEEFGDEYSCSVWVKPTGSHVHYEGAILSSGNWNNKKWAFGIGQNNTTIDPLGPGYNYKLACEIPVNEWTHLVSTVKNNIATVYKNGELVGTIDFGSLVLESDATNTTIGRETYGGGYFSFNGCIQDMRIYNHCLSPREIKEISKALVLHYPLSSGGAENILLNTATPMELDASAEYRRVNSYKTYSSTLSPKQLLLDGAAHGLTLSYDINVPAIYIDSGASLKRCGAYLGFKVTNKQTSNAINYYGHHTQSGEPTNLNTYIKTNALNSISSSSTASNPDTSFNGHYSRTIYPNQFNKLSDFYNNPDNYDVTFTGCHIEIRGGYIKDKCSISNLKLEVSDKATPWTPNPADDEYAAMGYDEPIEYDVSGYGNNATKVGTIVASGDTPRYSTSSSFDGSSYIINNTSTIHLSNEFTIAWWGKVNSWQKNWEGMFLLQNTPALQSGTNVVRILSCLHGSTQGVMDLAIGQAGANAVFDHYSWPYVLGEWAHYACTYKAGVVRMYKDGEQTYTATISDNSSNDYYFTIGRRNKNCDCQMSDFRIYNTALSDSDILALNNTPISLSNSGTLLTQGELLEV